MFESGATGEGNNEDIRNRGSSSYLALILTRGIFVLFALYLLSLAFYGDAARFHALFISAGLLTVWLERIDPHPEGSRNFRRLFFYSFVLFMVIHVISLICAMDLPGMEFSKRNNHNFYGFVIALTLGMGLRDRRSIHRLLWLMLAFFGGRSIFEIFSLPAGESFCKGTHNGNLCIDRFIGISQDNPNYVAMGLVILFSVYLCYAFITRDKRITGLVLCALGMTTLLLLLTRSRASLLTAAFVTIPVAFITQKRLFNFRKRLIIACLVFFLIAPLLAFSWYSTVDHPERKSAKSAIARFHLWQTSLDIVAHPPWYRLYIGYGNIKHVFSKVAKQYGTAMGANHSHNIYVQTLVENGILGLMTLIFIFGIVLLGVCREWKVQSLANGDISPVFITTIATILVVGQMDHVLKYLSGKLVWIILGLAFAYGKLGFQECEGKRPGNGRHSLSARPESN